MNRNILHTNKVYLSALDSYDFDKVKEVLFPLFENVICDNGFDKAYFDGKKVTIKPNLLAKIEVEKCVTSHPSFVKAACEYFCSLGAIVTVADSPGGVYNKSAFHGICAQTGMYDAVKETGASVNEDFGHEMKSDHDISKYSFNIINPIAEADVVVNLARLKTHALCEMSASVKNMFGSIPGLQKAEQHARFPERLSFADMLCDLCELTAPQINIIDAVICMEGNGPSGGTLRKMGAVIASCDPFSADVLGSYLMGYTPDEVGTVQRAVKRGLCAKDVNELCIIGEDKEKYKAKFIRPDSRAGGIVKQIPTIFGGRLRVALEPRPTVKKSLCVGCAVCAKNCPVDAIEIKEKKAFIDKTKCIKCYCCQEFCPQEAVKAKSSLFIH